VSCIHWGRGNKERLSLKNARTYPICLGFCGKNLISYKNNSMNNKLQRERERERERGAITQK